MCSLQVLWRCRVCSLPVPWTLGLQGSNCPPTSSSSLICLGVWALHMPKAFGQHSTTPKSRSYSGRPRGCVRGLSIQEEAVALLLGAFPAPGFHQAPSPPPQPHSPPQTAAGCLPNHVQQLESQLESISHAGTGLFPVVLLVQRAENHVHPTGLWKLKEMLAVTWPVAGAQSSDLSPRTPFFQAGAALPAGSSSHTCVSTSALRMVTARQSSSVPAHPSVPLASAAPTSRRWAPRGGSRWPLSLPKVLRSVSRINFAT